jgi:hypothetical protein
MPHSSSSSHPIRRSLFALAAAASLTLLGSLTGCMLGEDDGEGTVSDEVTANCAGAREWALNTTYTAGQHVTDTGDLFVVLVNHTAFAPDWNPKRAASLWGSLGSCGGAGNGGNGGGGNGGSGGGTPNPTTPPTTPPPTTPPPNNGGFDAFACLAQTGTNGGKFDAAGDFENVGNASGKQFITGRCLSNADCGSGCCAKPCGICSGPAVGAVAGKTGCGFDIRNPFAK